VPRTASEINGDKPLWSSNWSRSELANVLLVIIVGKIVNYGIRYSPVCEVGNMCYGMPPCSGIYIPNTRRQLPDGVSTKNWELARNWEILLEVMIFYNMKQIEAA